MLSGVSAAITGGSWGENPVSYSGNNAGKTFGRNPWRISCRKLVINSWRNLWNNSNRNLSNSSRKVETLGEIFGRTTEEIPTLIPEGIPENHPRGIPTEALRVIPSQYLRNSLGKKSWLKLRRNSGKISRWTLGAILAKPLDREVLNRNSAGSPWKFPEENEEKSWKGLFEFW